MQFIKALLGGLIGAAIGTAIYYWTNPGITAPMPWVALVTGLLSGLGVRLFCGADRSLITGIVAVVSTLALLIGWQIYAASTIKIERIAVMPVTNRGTPADRGKPPAILDDSGSVEKKEAATDKDDTDEGELAGSNRSAPNGDTGARAGGAPNTAIKGPDDVASDSRSVPPSGSPSQVRSVKSDSALQADIRMRNEAIAFGFAGLLAYALGCGSGKSATVRTKTDSGDSA